MKKGGKKLNRESISRFRDISLTILVIVIILGVLIFSLYYLDDDNTNTKFRKRYSSYNDGWTLVLGGERSMVDLPAKVHSGDDGTIVIKKVLPDTIPRYSAVGVRNFHHEMEVKLNGEVVYTYPSDENKAFNSILSDEWSIINLSSDSSRATMEIVFKNNSILPFDGYIGEVYFGDDNSIIQHLRDTSFWGFISGLILIIIGAILVIISWVYRKPTNQSPNTAMGFAFLCFGFWLSNRSKMPFFSTNNNAIFLFAMITMLLVAPFIFLYSYYRSAIYKIISIMGFRITLALAVFFVVTCFFIPYNVEVVAMVSYILILVAFLYNGVLLFRSSYGPTAKYRSNIELMLDKTEFYSNMVFPPAAVVEMIISKKELWTEVSGFFRLVLVIYASIYMVFVLWRTYLVVQDRAIVSEKLQESQLELMMGQIQPHFIFNTLSSIRTLVKIEPDVAYKMLYDFSNYLRANVDNVTNLDGIKFAAEAEHIKSYVNIEKVRFGDRLNVEYDIGVSDFIVPPLSIQPLVENAIKHGVVKKLEGGTVWLRSYSNDEYNIVEVEDTGIGFNQESASAVFSIYEKNNDRIGMESNLVAAVAMREVLAVSTLLDENGEPLVLTTPVIKEDYSGNGSEEHKSKGMLNIILRLKEMANATIRIESQSGKGTKFTVLFPKKKPDEVIDDIL